MLAGTFFDVGLAPSGRVFRTANGADGVTAVVARLRREGVVRVVLESIGGYAARLVRALADAGFEVGVVGALSTRRRQLVEMAAMEKVRLKQSLDATVADSCRQIIALLTAERCKVEAQLDAELRRTPDGEARLQLLQTITGVGPATSLILLADMPELGRLDRKTAASLAGLAPNPNQSGTRIGHAHIGGGRPSSKHASPGPKLLDRQYSRRVKPGMTVGGCCSATFRRTASAGSGTRRSGG